MEESLTTCHISSLRPSPAASPITSPTLKMGKSGHYSSSNKFPIASPIPRDLSHRPHIHGTWPPPASRASQPERTTWWAELGDGRAALDDGRQSLALDNKQAELDNRRPKDRRRRRFRGSGPDTARATPSPSHSGTHKMRMLVRALLGTA
jgi:hypothetical protein